MEFPRDEIEAAFRHQRELNDTQQWDAYADLFTDDGVYVEHEMGHVPRAARRSASGSCRAWRRS